ncbi:MAG: U32 family peptidase [Oscillospiraceae bacterium]|nr:U32 family peptidase [Oscillospiraceae bacterium]
MKNIELLAPAGDMESLRAAILYGANAVYIGGEGFGLRANAGFTHENLIQAVEHAHNHDKKIYLTCNIVANNSDVERFPQFIREAAETGIDAVIVSDLGFLDLVKTHAPDIDVHISTQAGVMNHASANMLYKLGAKRVILAREVSLCEIKRIRENTPPELEIETFVHGAMCMAFSGRCLISSYLTARDANRGQCSQPCRWSYHLMEETRPGEFFPVFENTDGSGSHIFNSKDLCMLEHIGDLIESGVTSLKIEGRAKTAYYTAVITNAYRAAINAYNKEEAAPKWALREVNCVSHRPYCTGFYLDEDTLQSYENSGYIRDCDFVGTVDGYCADENLLEITQRNHFTMNDYIEVVSPGISPVQIAIREMYNSSGERVSVANRATEKLLIKCETAFEGSVKGSMLRRVNKSSDVFTKSQERASEDS